MAGLYEIWRDPTRGRRRPRPRVRWTCTVHHHRRPRTTLGRIHDRMPLLVERDRWAEWLDPRAEQDDLLGLLVPAAPGALEAYPVSTAVSNVRNNGPELVEPLPLRVPSCEAVDDDRMSRLSTERTVATPHGEAPAGRHRRAPSPARHPRCSATAPAAASTPATWTRWPTALPGTASPWCCSSSRGRSPGARSPPRRRRSTGPGSRRPSTCASARPLVVGGRSAGARSRGPHGDAARRRGRAWRWPSRCTRPAGRRVPRSTSCAAAGVPTLVVQGERDPFGGPRSSPPRASTCAVVPGADHGLRVPKRGPVSAGRGPGRSSSSRRWSGSCARWSAECAAARRVALTDVIAVLERPSMPRVRLAADDRPCSTWHRLTGRRPSRTDEMSSTR